MGIRSKRLRIPVAPPLWMDVPSRKRPAFAGMTKVLQWSHSRVTDVGDRVISSLFSEF